MPKAGTNLTPSDVKKVRDIHKKILDANATLKAKVQNDLSGLTGAARQKAWGKAINRLIRSDALYKAAVRAELEALGIR